MVAPCCLVPSLAAAPWLAAAIVTIVGGAVGSDDDEQQRERMDPLSRELLFPRSYEVDDPEFVRLHPTTVHFENAQGAQLRGLWFESEKSDRTVLVCMGNTGNSTWMAPHAAILCDAGFDVLLFDYQGFGASEGVASLLSLPGDALAAWSFVTGEKGRKPEQVGVLGISLGSVLALQLAAEQQPRACAVEDVFFPDQQLEGFAGATTPGVKIALAGIKGLVLPKIDPRVNARKFKGPLFLMHGDLDWLLTPMATIELSERRPENTRTWILPNTGHSPDSLQIDEWEYRDQLGGFFQDAFTKEKLDEPRVTMTVLSDAAAPARATKQPVPVQVQVQDEEDVTVDLRLKPDGLAHGPRVNVHVKSDEAGPLQITFVAPRLDGATFALPPLQVHHARCSVTAGESDLMLDLPFVPVHVTAIRPRHAKLDSDGTWVPELSPMSQSFVELAQLERVFVESAQTVNVKLEWKEQNGHASRGFSRIAPGQWPAIRRQIPDVDSIHPRVRPRVALLLAEISRQLATTADELETSPAVALEAAAAMVQFLPPDPRNFVTLGNASISVGFDSPLVRSALTRLFEARLEKGDVDGAQAILRELVKYAPKELADRLEDPPLRLRAK